MPYKRDSKYPEWNPETKTFGDEPIQRKEIHKCSFEESIPEPMRPLLSWLRDYHEDKKLSPPMFD